jgi:hypothetical protein
MKKHSLILIALLFFTLSSNSQTLKGFSIGPEIQLPLSYNTENYFNAGYGGSIIFPIVKTPKLEINSSIGYVWYDMNSIDDYLNSYNNVYGVYELHSIPVKIMYSYYIGTTKTNKISLITGLAYQTFREELMGRINGEYIDMYNDSNETYLWPLIFGVHYERYLFWRMSAHVNIETHTSSYEFPNHFISGSSYLDLPTFISAGLKYNL